MTPLRRRDRSRHDALRPRRGPARRRGPRSPRGPRSSTCRSSSRAGRSRAAAAPAVVSLLRARDRRRRRRCPGTPSVASRSASTRGPAASRRPARVISSAKSWLSHPSVDRRAGILPLGAPEDIEKISPGRGVVALPRAPAGGVRRALRRRRRGARERRTWSSRCPRRSTRRRASSPSRRRSRRASRSRRCSRSRRPRSTRGPRRWATRGASRCTPGDVVLVVDVGGGTTRLLAPSRRSTRDGSLELVRVAVGDHILLGGDNMDLALGAPRAPEARGGGEAGRPLAGRRAWCTRAAPRRSGCSPTRRSPPRPSPSRRAAPRSSAARSARS